MVETLQRGPIQLVVRRCDGDHVGAVGKTGKVFPTQGHIAGCANDETSLAHRVASTSRCSESLRKSLSHSYGIGIIHGHADVPAMEHVGYAATYLTKADYARLSTLKNFSA